MVDVELKRDEICKRCHLKDDKKRSDEPFFYSSENHLDFGDVPNYLPVLEPAEEMLIARVHVAVNVFTVRGQQYKYRGHVVHFLRNVGKVYNQLPLLPQDLDIVILRPIGTITNPEMNRQFRRRFRIRRFVVAQWLEFLIQNHPGYRDLQLNQHNLNQLPEDNTIFDQLTIHEIDNIENVNIDTGPVQEEIPEENEIDIYDEIAVPNIAIKESELDLLQNKLNQIGKLSFLFN